MRPIPLKLRKQLSEDPFMRKCIHKGCNFKPEWEHAWIYSGKQINEAWAIVPCCKYHHRGDGLDKNYNKYIALTRADLKDLNTRLYKKNWSQEFDYLSKLYG